MDELTKRLAYAIRDTRGFHNEEARADQVRKQLGRHGVSLTLTNDLDTMYQQGRKDEREFPQEF